MTLERGCGPPFLLYQFLLSACEGDHYMPLKKASPHGPSDDPSTRVQRVEAELYTVIPHIVRFLPSTLQVSYDAVVAEYKEEQRAGIPDNADIILQHVERMIRLEADLDILLRPRQT